MSSIGRVGGGRGRISSSDEDLQRKLNAQAPVITHLFSRISRLFNNYRPQLIFIVVLVLSGAALSVIPPLLIESLFDDALFPESGVNIPLLTNLVLLMVGLYLASAALGVWQTYLTATVGNSVMGELRVRMFEHLQRMELNFFTRTKTGTIQSRLQNDVGGVANVLTNAVSNVLGNTVTVIAAAVAMLLLSWQMTIIAFVLMPVLVMIQRRIGRVRAKIASATVESLADMTAITQETLSVSGVLLSKSFDRQSFETDRYRAANRAQIRLQVRQAMSGQWFFATVNIILSSIPAVIYLVAGVMIGSGYVELTAGTIVAFTAAQSRLMFPLLGLMRVALDMQTSSGLFARIFEYLDMTPAIVDREGARVLSERLGAIEFTNVAFRYPVDGEDKSRGGEKGGGSEKSVGFEIEASTSENTLDGVSLRIEEGQFVAFVGPSGSGKTTLSYLVPRFYDATSGSVRIGGEDVRDLQLSSLVSRIGIVSQETYLFHDTIAQNFRYAKPEATNEEIIAAARMANIHETIVSFPDGYNTVVGERGYRLSGGEKQRVAIARVLLKDPDILILDEATSALDSNSERIVQQALDTVSRGRTTLSIAHRLSTVSAADRIFVMEKGRIVEQGTHTELLGAGGLYTELYEGQRLDGSGGVPGEVVP
ncbi:ABC transporter ATP-binding protein [Lysinibacter sp. HNR]|uniref:ABC transporter ATP-binding protein n=1 Tax=Lysinibacter sp. HNR TaxID=3031408 RepID=UPI00243534E2|nr:ABC transporter ATP-binding protein [Lysinibacter sp. HNR]WGD38107.1 ABC transporter ATP-binding protein [Lysinibacter sp. HNR]